MIATITWIGSVTGLGTMFIGLAACLGVWRQKKLVAEVRVIVNHHTDQLEHTQRQLEATLTEHGIPIPKREKPPA